VVGFDAVAAGPNCRWTSEWKVSELFGLVRRAMSLTPRWVSLLCDLIEEYGRHTGHADLLREAVDGRVGEDPPAGWHPESHRHA